MKKEYFVIMLLSALAGMAWLVPSYLFDFPAIITGTLPGVTTYLTGSILIARAKRRHLGKT